MAYLDVHANANPRTRASVPFLLDVQADLLTSLGTRVVVPLYRREAGQALTRLTPLLDFQGQGYLAMVPELAGVGRRELGPVVGSLAPVRAELLAALDLLFKGV